MTAPLQVAYYKSSDAVKVVKYGIIIWAGRATRMGEVRNAHGSLFGRPERK